VIVGHVDGGRDVQYAAQCHLNAFCTDIASHLYLSEAAVGACAEADEVSCRSTHHSGDWWSVGFGRPGAIGAQNEFRFTVFRNRTVW
jgi:hypothetical protein